MHVCICTSVRERERERERGRREREGGVLDGERYTGTQRGGESKPVCKYMDVWENERNSGTFTHTFERGENKKSSNMNIAEKKRMRLALFIRV